MFQDIDETFDDDDLKTLADARRLSMAFNLTGCSLLTDSAVVATSRFCTSLQALTRPSAGGLAALVGRPFEAQLSVNNEGDEGDGAAGADAPAEELPSSS